MTKGDGKSLVGPSSLIGSPESKAGGTQVGTQPGCEVRRLQKLALSVLEAPQESEVGRRQIFAQEEILIGSQPGMDWVCDDRKVSREHLRIRFGERGWLLVDNDSTNGTFVGEIRIHRVVIRKAAVVCIGQTKLKLEPLQEHVEDAMSAATAFYRMLGQSESMRAMFAVLERVAPSDLTVLIEGETGTGKELAAEGIHAASGRSGPFVTLNCGAIPRELMESELMGHVKGAFTGAVSDRSGAFRAAEGGTLFLDEVGELPAEMQVKLLRILEHREVKAVGADRVVPVDVRVVAATNRKLLREVEAENFRQDLYYRLAVAVVRVPPLRRRPEDLPLLIEHMQAELGRRRELAGRPPCPPMDGDALKMLAHYEFPGNVRELRNMVERWSVLGAEAMLNAGPLRPRDSVHGDDSVGTVTLPDEGLLQLPYHEAKDDWIGRFERRYVEAALARNEGNVSRAAREVKVDRRHLQRVMARYGIKKS